MRQGALIYFTFPAVCFIIKKYTAISEGEKNEKGFVTIEKLAEQIDSSPNMLYNLTSKKVKQGVSLVFLDKLARTLDISLYCLFLKEPLQNPPKYDK